MIADLAALPIDAGTDAEMLDALRLLPVGMGFLFIIWVLVLVALIGIASRRVP